MTAEIEVSRHTFSMLRDLKENLLCKDFDELIAHLVKYYKKHNFKE